jgi:predicted anti-sigma-YlaC factor YlaD
MHRTVKDNLEEYLREEQSAILSQQFLEHIRQCEKCRRELHVMKEQALLLRTLRTSETLEPTAGFYARVLDRIESQRLLPIWNVFLDPVFASRLAVACVALLAILAGFFFTSHRQAYDPAASPAYILAADPHEREVVGTSPAMDRDTVLVSLATYQE